MEESEDQAVVEFTFVVDTREKRPYIFPGAKSATLSVGDYTVEGFEDRFAIERKSYEDIYASLTKRLTSFRSQLRRLGQLHNRYLLIDCTLSAFMLGHVFHKLPGPQALERLTRLCHNYGVPFCFCDRHGPALAASLLLQFYKEATD